MEFKMSNARRIAKNTTVLFIATIIGYIFAFFTNMYSARYLGAEGFGIISLALAITGIFGIFTDLGLNTLTVREVSRNKGLRDKFVSNTLLMKILLSFLTFGLVVITVNILNYQQTVSNVVYLITLSVIFGGIYAVFNSIFQAEEKMEYISIGNILNCVLLFLGVMIAIYYQMEIIVFAAMYVVVSVLVLLYTVTAYLWKHHLPQIKIDLNFWKPTLKEALPFGITAVFVNIYFWISSVMLSFMDGTEAVGWYNAAYRLILFFIGLITVYMTSIFPAMSSFYKTSSESLKFAYERSFKYLLITSIPIAVGTTLISDRIILLVYGTGYIPAIIALQIMVWTLVFMFINTLSGYLMGSINQQMAVTKISAIGAIINVALNVVLIPTLGYVGSSIATVLTEFSFFPLFMYIIVRANYINGKTVLKILPKILLANLIMAIFVMYFKDINLILLVISATVVYLISLYLSRSIDDVDMELLKSIISKK